MVLVCNLEPSYILPGENQRLLHWFCVFESKWKAGSGSYSPYQKVNFESAKQIKEGIIRTYYSQYVCNIFMKRLAKIIVT